MIKKSFVVLGIVFFLTAKSYAQPDKGLKWVPAAIHVSTTISDGSLTLDQVAAVAHDKGIKALIVTDRDSMKWEYGLWPFRRIFKKTVESNSVFKYGLDKYLNDIELESRKYPDMVIIPGLESAPFYYWKGNPFGGDLRIHGWHKHLLIALPKSQDYRGLPVLEQRWKPVALWPFTAFILGFVLLRIRPLGILIIALSILGFVNNFPLRRGIYEPYDSNAGEKPYQALIDYVAYKKGVSFWAHPEADVATRRGAVGIQTEDQIKDMWATRGYTGFSVFYEGYKHVGAIGGDWDGLLKEYAVGRRSEPVWAIAGLAFDTGTKEDFAGRLDDLHVYVLTRDASAEGIISSLRDGRMVVSRGQEPRPVILDDFSVGDSGTLGRAILGETWFTRGLPVVAIKGHVENGDQGPIAIRLVKDGRICWEFSAVSAFDIRYEDSSLSADATYYRVEIRKGAQVLLTNPIFVQKVLA